MINLPFYLVLKLAITHINIFSGVTFMVEEGGMQISVKAKPTLYRPTKGSVEAYDTPWGKCQGSFSMNYKKGTAKISFPDCPQGNHMVFIRITKQEYLGFLNGEPINGQIAYEHEGGVKRPALIRLL